MGIFDFLKNKTTNQNWKQEDIERYKSMFDSTNDAVMTLEPPEWKFTKGNFATLKMFNCMTDGQFESLPPWELSPEKQPDGQLSSVKAKAMIEKAMKEGSNFFEWTHKRYNGPSFPATVLLTKIKFGDREFLQAVVRDISKEKEIEAKLKEKSTETDSLKEHIKELEEKLVNMEK
jgi:PAS domain S-box-containing protein